MRRALISIALALVACTAPQAPASAPSTAEPTAAPRATRVDPAAVVDEKLACTERVAIRAIPDVVDVRWSPDSSALAVVRYVRVPSKYNITGYEEQRWISIVDPATGNMRDVNVATHPEWSASGTYLSYWRDENKRKEDEFLRIVKGSTTVGLVDSTQPDARWIGEELFYWYDSEIRSWKDGKIRTVAKVDVPPPVFPAEDVAFSADGERFTLARYLLSGVVKRYAGVTRTGELTPIDDTEIGYMEWSTRGATLLLRSRDRITLRAADGRQQSATLDLAATVHGWTADGRLLLGSISPTVPGGNTLDRFSVFGEPVLATLPNVMGARAFSPDGGWFAGVSRTGLDSTQLELFRCGTGVAADLRADPAARARAQRIESDEHRLARPVAGAVAQYFQGKHTGIDVATPNGSIVYADDDGVVSSTEWVPVGGYRVCVQHDATLESCAYHSSIALVRVGDHVVRGQPIALVGMTGLTLGPHVHWEVKRNGMVIDPLSR